MGAHRSRPLGNRAEKSHRTLGQFLRTRLAMEACQRHESNQDSHVNASGLLVMSGQCLDFRCLFRRCQAKATVKYQFFLILAERTHEAHCTPGECFSSL